jgi:hypothetical protein
MVIGAGVEREHGLDVIARDRQVPAAVQDILAYSLKKVRLSQLS